MATGGVALKSSGTAVSPSTSHQLVMDDLDDLLARRDRAGDLGADGALAHLLDEGLDHLERDVGLEQRAADFAQRRIDVGFAERAAARQSLEDLAKPVAKALEHLLSSGPRQVARPRI